MSMLWNDPVDDRRGKKSRKRKKAEPKVGKKVIHCNWCFQLFTQHQEDQIVCHACRREDGWSKLPPVQRFRHPMNEWLSGKPVTKTCQHEY